jgi:hypothetical protein
MVKKTSFNKKLKYKPLTVAESVAALRQILDSGETTDKFEHLLLSLHYHLNKQLLKQRKMT